MTPTHLLYAKTDTHSYRFWAKELLVKNLSSGLTD